MKKSSRVLKPLAGGRSHRLDPARQIPVGSGPGGIVLSGSGISAQHAVLQANEGEWFVHDLGSTGGTYVDGVPTEGWVHIPLGSRLRFGSIEFLVEPGGLSRLGSALASRVRSARHSWRTWIPSLALHAFLLFLLTRVVISVAEKENPDFVTDSDSTGFLVDPGPRGEPPGGEAAAGPSNEDLAAIPLQVSMPDPAAFSAITTTAPGALQFSMPAAAAPSRPSAAALGVAAKGLGGGGTSFRSAGFGKNSGFGKGVGDWIGGGSGGIGISGRGKTLKTVNEFSVFFVIHSGDWYAALDTRHAPEGRNKEVADPGLPDNANIDWAIAKPVPGQGPFINYFWGMRERRNEASDDRRSLVEFTPGAMGNLLRFVRQASADNIKGSYKPAAVVLDRALIPYTYNATTKQMTWNPEGRENLRQVLREGLPKFTNYYGGSFGYLWNPQPADKAHPDFTVEYLLDVRPMPPFIYFTGNDDFVLSDAEVETLYQYVLRGGAIWGDSGFAGEGSKFDVAFKREIKRVIPDLDKPFRTLKKENDLFTAGPDAYFDKTNGFDRLPYGMQFYDAPIEVIEMIPGLVSVVLTRNGYGNFLRFETTVINNRFQIGGQKGRGTWAATMWTFREEFFRGLGEGAIVDSYKLGTNILVYMLGRWPAVLNRPENRGLLQ